MSYIKEVLQEAALAGASDVHLAVGLPPKLRINGKFLDLPGEMLIAEDLDAVMHEIMDEKQREIFRKEGEYDMSFTIAGQGRYRVSAYQSRGTAAVAFHLIASRIPSLKQLGAPDFVTDLCQKKRGLILVAGPVGSGKSTTLAAMTDRINGSRDAHIITLESPIEYILPHKMSMVNQREIGRDATSYAKALRAALREDADVILLEEMRDCRAIREAVAAAEAGCLVLSALHANDVSDALSHLVDAFPLHQKEQICNRLSNVLEAVISQQLLPRADGNGRAVAFEVLPVSVKARSLIREGKMHAIRELMRANHREGMVTMEEAVRALVCAGTVSRQTAGEFVRDMEQTADA